MGVISKFHLELLNGLKTLSGLVVFAIFAVIAVDVFVRLFGGQPWAGTNGLVEYGLLWFTMLAAPWLARVKGHVFIDAAVRLLGPAGRLIVSKLAYTLCIIAAGVFCVYSAELLIEAIESGQLDDRGVDMPIWTLILPMPFCFFLVTIEFLRFLIGIDDMYRDAGDYQDSI